MAKDSEVAETKAYIALWDGHKNKIDEIDKFVTGIRGTRLLWIGTPERQIPIPTWMETPVRNAILEDASHQTSSSVNFLEQLNIPGSGNKDTD